ncbi:hypothetical protein MKW98_024095 [Papaver atlanticum]|uniref:Uncharacterized protein n=1 Tax=Papaver atlanticum TaxID=357466 RepID=A0AAD4T010_9MAGN|nr:hypothetical protein MKW98_024095 [Papaver atlanticum]
MKLASFIGPNSLAVSSWNWFQIRVGPWLHMLKTADRLRNLDVAHYDLSFHQTQSKLGFTVWDILLDGNLSSYFSVKVDFIFRNHGVKYGSPEIRALNLV